MLKRHTQSKALLVLTWDEKPQLLGRYEIENQ